MLHLQKYFSPRTIIIALKRYKIKINLYRIIIVGVVILRADAQPSYQYRGSTGRTPYEPLNEVYRLVNKK